MLDPASPEQKKILKEFCEVEFAQQVDYLRNRYELVDYNPKLILSFRTDAAASYGGELKGGKPFILFATMTIAGAVGKTGKFPYEEYPFLKNKEGIGDDDVNWKQYCAWTMAHELAHTLVECAAFRPHVQTYYPHEISRDLRGHGFFWQHLYRDIRVKFCTADRYPVRWMDLSKAVWYKTRKAKGIQYLTFFRNDVECGWYIKDGSTIWKSNSTWTRKTATKYQKASDIRRKLVSV